MTLDEFKKIYEWVDSRSEDVSVEKRMSISIDIAKVIVEKEIKDE